MRWFCMALLALALLAGLPRPAQAAVDAAAAETLMRDSGLWQQLAQLQAGVRQGFLAGAQRSGRGAPSAEQRAAAVAAIDAAYDPSRLRAAVQAILQRELEPAHLERVEDWLRSPVGRLMTQLEERASEVRGDDDARIRHGLETFSAATPERQRLLQQLATETQATEQMASMMLQTMIGVQRGVQRAQPDRPGPGPEAMRAEIEKQHALMLKLFAPISVAMYADTYAEASDTQLGEALAFASSEAGRRFTTLVMQSVERALRGAAESLGEDLVHAQPGSST